ncbi:MAG: hypothetical protein AB7M12_09650 [Hyphomonadaceae bacterium]
MLSVRDISNFMRRVVLRTRYAFDRTMAAGPIALIGWLGLASLLVTAAAAAVLAAARIAPDGAKPLGFGEAFWEATMRTIDAGNVGGDNGWDFRFVMLAVTFWGIFVVSALIGLLSAGVTARLDELRKGRSLVLERGHAVILNWSDAIFDVIAELLVAHEKDARFSIVVLADKDKVEMEDEIAAKIGRRRRRRIVCRRGDPSDLHDLAIANVATAASVVMLSPAGDDPDSHNIKTAMALMHGPSRCPPECRIAAEFRDPHNAEIARAIGGDAIQTVLGDDLVSRIIVHSSRQAGLSGVYLELLGFEGCEIYANAMPRLAGLTFAAAALSLEDGALIGMCEADGAGLRLNPPADAAFGPDTLAIYIAEDRDGARFAAETAELADAAIRHARKEARAIERTLILGWNRRGPQMIRRMARYLAPGSHVTVAATAPRLTRDIAELAASTEGVSLAAATADACDRKALEALKPGAFDHVVVLAEGDHAHAQQADTRTLVTLLHLRHIADRDGAAFTVVSEIADVRNRELAAVTRADDFVVSHRLVSLMLAQAAESRYVSAIFDELLNEEGSEIYMRPAANLVALDTEVDFYTVTEAALRRGETAIGYPDGAPGAEKAVVLNPPKSRRRRYGAQDRIVVLAEE